MFVIKFVRYPASITYLCHMYLIATFKILHIEYWPTYQILEFFLLPNIDIGIGDQNPISVGALMRRQRIKEKLSSNP